MFFRDPGGNSGPSLFTIDISGRNEQRVPTPGFASDPAWSPLAVVAACQPPLTLGRWRAGLLDKRGAGDCWRQA